MQYIYFKERIFNYFYIFISNIFLVYLVYILYDLHKNALTVVLYFPVLTDILSETSD